MRGKVIWANYGFVCIESKRGRVFVRAELPIGEEVEYRTKKVVKEIVTRVEPIRKQ